MAVKHQGKILAVAVVGAVGLLGYMAKSDREQDPPPVHYVLSLQLSLEPGQADLDELVKDPRLENFWDVVEKVVYDPGLVKSEGVFRGIIQNPATGNGRLITATQRALQQLVSARESGSLPYAVNVPKGNVYYNGKKSTIFVEKNFFNLPTWDDRVSTLGHEQKHADIAKNGFLLGKEAWKQIESYFPDRRFTQEIMTDDELTEAYNEGWAYAWQRRTAVFEKKFRLSDPVLRAVETRDNNYRAVLEQISQEKTLRGKVARAMRDSLPFQMSRN